MQKKSNYSSNTIKSQKTSEASSINSVTLLNKINPSAGSSLLKSLQREAYSTNSEQDNESLSKEKLYHSNISNRLPPIQAKIIPSNNFTRANDSVSIPNLNKQRVYQIGVQGLKGRSESLPHLERIQKSFGRYNLTNVRSYVDKNAAINNHLLRAHAYTMGDNIAFKKRPSLHTAAHEAAHVIQQRSGITLPNGIDKNNDIYERHANRVADAVVAGKSVESYFDTFATNPMHAHNMQYGGQKIGIHLIQRVLAQIIPSDAKDDTIKKLIIAGRPKSPFSDTMGDHTTAFTSHEYGLKLAVENKTYTEAYKAVKQMVINMYSLPGMEAADHLPNKIKDQLEYAVSQLDSLENEIENSHNSNSNVLVVSPLKLQDYIIAFLQARELIPFSLLKINQISQGRAGKTKGESKPAKFLYKAEKKLLEEKEQAKDKQKIIQQEEKLTCNDNSINEDQKAVKQSKSSSKKLSKLELNKSLKQNQASNHTEIKSDKIQNISSLGRDKKAVKQSKSSSKKLSELELKKALNQGQETRHLENNAAEISNSNSLDEEASVQIKSEELREAFKGLLDISGITRVAAQALYSEKEMLNMMLPGIYKEEEYDKVNDKQYSPQEIISLLTEQHLMSMKNYFPEAFNKAELNKESYRERLIYVIYEAMLSTLKLEFANMQEKLKRKRDRDEKKQQAIALANSDKKSGANNKEKMIARENNNNSTHANNNIKKPATRSQGKAKSVADSSINSDPLLKTFNEYKATIEKEMNKIKNMHPPEKVNLPPTSSNENSEEQVQKAATLIILDNKNNICNIILEGRTKSPFASTMGAHTTAWIVHQDAIRTTLKGMNVKDAIEKIKKMFAHEKGRADHILTHYKNFILDFEYRKDLLDKTDEAFNRYEANYKSTNSDNHNAILLQQYINLLLTYINFIPGATFLGTMNDNQTEQYARKILMEYENNLVLHKPNELKEAIYTLFDIKNAQEIVSEEMLMDLFDNHLKTINKAYPNSYKKASKKLTFDDYNKFLEKREDKRDKA